MLRKGGHTECDHQLSPLEDSLPNLTLLGIVGFGMVFLGTCLQDFDGINFLWAVVRGLCMCSAVSV